MISDVPFQTKARTVDHLGREQIADCPTAISELWKNSFDAYARHVELNIYDGDEPVAAILDDGHGMNRDEFVNRWLVVGTESKATTDKTPIEDRNNLPVRTRQGQKGIGRLSCANLGPILLFISKRRNNLFVAALVDWRLFENPYLNLSDVFIPVVEFADKNELFGQIPGLIKNLSENVSGGEEGPRKTRLQHAWAAYDDLFRQEKEEGRGNKERPPSVEILSTITQTSFSPRHLEQWSVWNGCSDCGTALLVSRLNFDLVAQLEEGVKEASVQAAQSRFFETLSGFVDPFVDPSDIDAATLAPEFTYSARAWSGNLPRVLVSSDKHFSLTDIGELEQVIVGRFDPSGLFRGRIKAFGKWLPSECVIHPPKDLTVPKRADTILGPVQLYIAAMEFDLKNTTMPDAEYQHFKDLAERYAGFMVYRDGLRVLPFGRTDNDFFDIEMRRSKHAGREYWNHRQMFGRLAITRDNNPNLKDKAGREGLLDNRAAKTLKGLISNVLMQSARLYFGTDADVRKSELPEIKAANASKRAAEEQEKLRKLQRRKFGSELKTFVKNLPAVSNEIEAFQKQLSITNEADISDAQSKLENFRERLTSFRLPGVPKSLGVWEDSYIKYRSLMRTSQEVLKSVDQTLEERIAVIKPVAPKELLEKQKLRNAAQISRRIQIWKQSIEALQKTEVSRIQNIIEQRAKLFHVEATALLHRFDTEQITYPAASKLMAALKQRIDDENDGIFPPYIGALESLKESIDLEHIATFGLEELADLRSELDRLNSLAQLGIAVEITGHELQSYDDIIGSALRQLPDDVRATKAAKDIEFGYEGLTDQLRFLSPLRLAGQKIQRWITGDEIAEYIFAFFKLTLIKSKIEFVATDKFRKFRVFDQQSRLYPVFINLVNNSIYWLAVTDMSNRQIIFDVVDNEIVVSDNGPGIDQDDVASLFSLFFTKKLRGGRGVGLYLCRANLAAGGHKIRYERAKAGLPLHGANFIISFRGAEFDAK